jgi:O-antigen ligase
MVAAIIFFTLLSVAVIVLMVSYSPRFTHERKSINFSTLVFSFWVVATIILTPYTFALKIPGLPDLSVERLTFILLLSYSAWRVYRRDIVHSKSVLIEILMLLFCVFCLVSMIRFGFVESYIKFARPSYVFLIGYLIPFVGFLYAKYLLGSQADIQAFFKILFLFGCYLVLVSFLEHYGFKSLVFPGYIVDANVSELHLDRSRGPFLNSAFNGLAMNIAFICGLFVLPSIKGPSRLVYICMLALFIPAIYYTRTRSVYLHFAMTLSVLFFLYKTRFALWKIFPALLFVVFVFVIANIDKLASADREAGGLGQTAEIYIRLALATKSLNLIVENPFGGIGLAQFRTASLFSISDVEYQHNHIIGMAVELGIPATLVYICILALIFWRIYVVVGVIPDNGEIDKNFMLLIATCLFVNLINNIFVEPSLHMFSNLNFFIFAGIADFLYNKYYEGRHRMPIRQSF